MFASSVATELGCAVTVPSRTSGGAALPRNHALATSAPCSAARRLASSKRSSHS
jgi:hypothetical protein